RARVLCGWYASLCGLRVLRRRHDASSGVRAEGRDNVIVQLLGGEIGAVDLNIGASVGVHSLVHQFLDSREHGFAAFGEFRTLRLRPFDAGGDDFGPRRETHDQADALERRAVRLVNQHAAAGGNHFGIWAVAMGAAPAIAGQTRDRLALELAEVGLAVVGEYLRDLFSDPRDDDRVQVHEFPSEPPRDERADRAFP